MKKWLTDARLDVLTNARTGGARRFLGLGFRLFDVETADYLPRCAQVLRARFVCVCGRTEFWTQTIDEHCDLEWQNVYDYIVRFGATSRAHLLEDKYTVEQIDDMERRLASFELTPQIEERARCDVRGMRWVEIPRFHPTMRGVIADFKPL